MKKIYTHAENEIKWITKEFLKYGLRPNEIIWKLIDVQDELVIFQIHHELRLLILKHIVKSGFPHAKLSFTSKGDDLWNIAIENNGAESHYFARILFSILKEFEGINMTAEERNREILGRAMDAAIRKAGKNPADFKTSISVDHSGCKASIKIPPSFTCIIDPESVDEAAKKIGRQVPQLIRELTRERK